MRRFLLGSFLLFLMSFISAALLVPSAYATDCVDTADHYTVLTDWSVRQSSTPGDFSGHLQGYTYHNEVLYFYTSSTMKNWYTVGNARYGTSCAAVYGDTYPIHNPDGTTPEPDHCSNLTKDEDETGMDCGGSCGECKWTCENGDEPVLNIVDGKKYCEVYSAVNPAGVCPDDYGRIEGTSECIYRYPASALNSEYSSDLADYPDIPSNLPAEIDNTQESSATTVESETTTSPDGSVTQKITETTKATDASGTTTDTTKTTETTTKPDGTKTEQLTTETKISTATGADGKITTTATTNIYAADGTLLSSTTNTSTGSSSNSSGTGSPTKPTTMNVSLDLGPVTERIDKSNETLDDIKKTLSVDDADENAPIEKFNSTVENAIEDSQDELHDYMRGMENPGFGDLPFNESINSEIGKFVPGGKTCTDLVFPYEFMGQSQTFVIECDNFEKYLKPILTWVFYCFTAVMCYYSFTAPVGEN